MNNSVYINDTAVVTPFGIGIEKLWNGLITNKNTIKECRRFSVENFQTTQCSAINITPSEESIIWALLDPIREQIKSWNVDFLILATTKGEIDLLEKQCRINREDSAKASSLKEFTLSIFLEKCLEYLYIKDGTLISAACVSSNLAIGKGREMILNNRAKNIAVVGIDILSHFVFSGFSALQALSTDNNSITPAKPFDANRDGLIIGEAAAAVLLSKDPIKNSELFGQVVGSGAAADANHVTGPSRSGDGLASAISEALKSAHITHKQISAISAHGTATKFNDNMEMLAFKSIFQSPIPTFSIKGSLGHTMGAAGVLETIVSLKSLQQSKIPPTVGFNSPDENSNNWISNSSIPINSNYILKTNSGFGGINAALIIA